MPDATTRSGGTATAAPPAVALRPTVAVPVPLLTRAGLVARATLVWPSPYARLALLLLLLAGAATTVLVLDPQRYLTQGWPPQLGGFAAAGVFALAYGVCTVAFVPRPLLNLAAGALFGSALGLTSALAGTVLGAGLAF
ncbi:hypothetical protein GTW73_10160, partial [Streptomyces sp. SID4982]|nr:hypothetical protein [Streptomyces sp. SID4982]